MAKGGFERVKVTRRGEQAIANSAAVQALVSREAGWMQGAANAALGENVYDTRTISGRFADGRTVSCALGNSETGHVFDDADRREQVLRDLAGE